MSAAGVPADPEASIGRSDGEPTESGHSHERGEWWH